LSQNGYDVVGCDRRGYGFSEGDRVHIISLESVREDMLAYSLKVNEKLGGADVPHFTIGHSLGCSIQLFMAAEQPELFAGMTMIAPFIAITDTF